MAYQMSLAKDTNSFVCLLCFAVVAVCVLLLLLFCCCFLGGVPHC